jgi:thioredoxin reductase (NADPH)
MQDVLIIGAGPAGLSAAFWCDELGLDALLVEQRAQVGGQLCQVYGAIQNYLGLRVSSGAELVERFTAGLEQADFDLWTNVEIESVNLQAKTARLRSGEEIQAIAMMLATGVRRRELGIPGEREFAGRGIIESATRDRHLFAGQDVCVIGGGDAAAENALLLAEVCATVTVVHRGKTLRARAEFSQGLMSRHSINVFTQAEVRQILGNDRVAGVEIYREGALKPFQMAVTGVLIRIGVVPNTELFAGQLDTDEQGYIMVDSTHETSIKNVFAIGDVANPLAPTISGATGSGATAAKVVAARLTSGHA